jgi:hypothetical protein
VSDMSEYQLVARHDGSCLTVRREVVSSATRTVMLRIDSPLTGLAAAYLTDTEARMLADNLTRATAKSVTACERDSHHMNAHEGHQVRDTPAPSDPWAGHNPFLLADVPPPDDVELAHARCTFAEAERARQDAGTRLARVHCHRAAYAVVCAYPTAAWIVVDIVNEYDDVPAWADLIAVHDHNNDLLAEHGTADDEHFTALAATLDSALQEAIAAAPHLPGWSGRRTLSLGLYLCW